MPILAYVSLTISFAMSYLISTCCMVSFGYLHISSNDIFMKNLYTCSLKYFRSIFLYAHLNIRDWTLYMLLEQFSYMTLILVYKLLLTISISYRTLMEISS